MARLLHGRSRGQSLVEFALCLTILLPLLCAAVDFGRWFYTDITLTQAARDGARVLAASTSTGSGPGAGPACQAVTDATANLPGPVQCASECPSDPTCTTPSDGGPAGQQVNVTVTYMFDPITPISPFVGRIQVTARATMVSSW